MVLLPWTHLSHRFFFRLKPPTGYSAFLCNLYCAQLSHPPRENGSSDLHHTYTICLVREAYLSLLLPTVKPKKVKKKKRQYVGLSGIQKLGSCPLPFYIPCLTQNINFVHKKLYGQHQNSREWFQPCFLMWSEHEATSGTETVHTAGREECALFRGKSLKCSSKEMHNCPILLDTFIN